jgi:hypothetical protein
MKPLVAAVVILGIAAAIFVSIACWFVSARNRTIADTRAEEACTHDPALRPSLTPDQRGDIYERCLAAHGVAPGVIPKRTSVDR